MVKYDSTAQFLKRATTLNPSKKRLPSEKFKAAVKRCAGSVAEKAVGFALVDYMKMYLDKGEQCHPGVKSLSRDSGACEKTVRDAVKMYESYGLLTVARRNGAASRYALGWRLDPGTEYRGTQVVRTAVGGFSFNPQPPSTAVAGSPNRGTEYLRTTGTSSTGTKAAGGGASSSPQEVDGSPESELEKVDPAPPIPEEVSRVPNPQEDLFDLLADVTAFGRKNRGEE